MSCPEQACETQNQDSSGSYLPEVLTQCWDEVGVEVQEKVESLLKCGEGKACD